MEIVTLLVMGGGVVLGFAAGYLLRRWGVSAKRGALDEESKQIILKAQEKAAMILAKLQDEERERKKELHQYEERLVKKEDTLDKERERVRQEGEAHGKRKEELAHEAEALREKEQAALQELERISGVDRETAKGELMKQVAETYRVNLAEEVVRLERERKEVLEQKALNILTSVIQRSARAHVGDVTTSVVPLLDEDLKGKIIGREGRNIRAFERLTGVEVIVDEVPEGIVLSSFDPLRREVARIALEKLIKDGRIQPARIEEKVEEARSEMEEHIFKVGEEAAYDAGVLDLPREIVEVLGKLKFRTSYGQNVLQHSVEMTHIAAAISAELGLDVDVTRRAALLHDIGKAIDHEVEGTHVEIGRKLLKKYGIDEKVILAMEAHHEEYPFSTPESYVVAAADSISAARPGARRETLEKYLKRLEDIERVVNTFQGVQKAYAVSAGREVRVFVVPEKIDDFGALTMAKNIADKLKSDVKYPGEIKVTVIREVRAVEYAR